MLHTDYTAYFYFCRCKRPFFAGWFVVFIGTIFGVIYWPRFIILGGWEMTNAVVLITTLFYGLLGMWPYYG